MLNAAPRGSALSCQSARSEPSAAMARSNARHVLLGPAPEHLEEEVVHRAEVVVDELRLEAGLGRHPPGGDRGVALLEQQELGGVEQLGAGLRVHGTDAAGRGGGRHADYLATPASPVLSSCTALLCGCTAAARKETRLSDWQTIDFFTDESLVEDPYPYFDELRVRSARCCRSRTSAWWR